MKKLLLGLLALGVITQFYAQEINDGMLPEVVVHATNYKYLNSVDNSEATVPIQLLQDMAAKFDIKSSEYYVDGDYLYRVYFYIPDGKIVAAYDRNGKILYTIEKFKNVALRDDVASSVAERFPGWKIAKDVYFVKYSTKSGAQRQYKIVLKNGKKTIRVKVDEDGVFL